MNQNEEDYALIMKMIQSINDGDLPDRFTRNDFIDRCISAARSNAESKTGLGLGMAFCLLGSAMSAMKSE